MRQPLRPDEPSEKFTVKLARSDREALRQSARKMGVKPSVIVREALLAYLASQNSEAAA